KNGNLKFCNQRTLGAGGKNVVGLGEDDIVKDICYLTSDKNFYAFTDKGNVARILASDLPERSWKDKGIPFIKLVPQADKEERVIALLCPDENKLTPESSWIFFTTEGMAKRTLVQEYITLTKSYFQATVLKDEEKLINVCEFDAGSSMIFVTQDGMVLNAELTDVPVQGRRSSGVRGIQLNTGDKVVFASIIDDMGELIVVTELGYGKRMILAEFDVSKRYRKGTKAIDTDLSRGPIVFSDVVKMPYMVAFFYDDGDSELVFTDFIDIQMISDIGSYIPSNRNARIISAGKHRTN
ncbi:MAG TPA: hypothetical protein DIC18_02990, partial [Clostridiales bacterium]|nr:hypothetical protein [Clostridiales bacterium]